MKMIRRIFGIMMGIGLVLSFSLSAEAYIVTFYPDADPESSSVDGHIGRFVTNGTSWSDIHNGAGIFAYDHITDGIYVHWQDHSGQLFRYLRRGVVLFDTSSLPDDAVITSAVLSLFGASKQNDNGASAALNIYSFSPSSNTSLSSGDYQSFGTTPYSDNISYADWSTTGYNEFTLNTTGISAISTTGISAFGVREANYDVANIQPPTGAGSTTNMYMVSYAAEQGDGYKPKLEITYSSSETIPEPTSLLLLGFGVFGIAIFKRRVI